MRIFIYDSFMNTLNSIDSLKIITNKVLTYKDSLSLSTLN